MKKHLVVALLCMASTIAMADDVIVYRNGDVVRGKVEEITKKSVKYKKLDNLDGPLYSIDKRELLSVQYENGTVDLLSDPIEVEEIEVREDDGNSLKFCPQVGLVLGTLGSGSITGGGGVEFVANFKVNDYLKMGPGAGMMGHNYDYRNGGITDVSTFEMPIFFNIQANFTKSAVSPYVVGQVGYNFGSISYTDCVGCDTEEEEHMGMFAKMGVGIDFNLRRGAIYVDLGYKIHQWTIDTTPTYAEFSIGYKFRR